MNDQEQQVDGFDLSQFEMEDFATLTVKNIRGDDDLMYHGQPVQIDVWSPGSKQGVKALHKAGRAAQMRFQRTLRNEIDKNDAELAEQERVQKLVAFTKEIRNFPIPGGAEALYSNPKLGYVISQVEQFIGKESNFSKQPIAS